MANDFKWYFKKGPSPDSFLFIFVVLNTHYNFNNK